MLKQKSLFAKDSKTFKTLKTLIRYKKHYNEGMLGLVSDEFVKEKSFRAFHREIESLIELAKTATNSIPKEHFKNILDQHLEENVCNDQLDHFYGLLLTTHFTKKPDLCLQMVLNKVDLEALFQEYQGASLANRRLIWEVMLQAVSRKMVSSSQASHFLETILSDFVTEKNRTPNVFGISQESPFGFDESEVNESFQVLVEAVNQSREASFFSNIWLFDKKLVQMMLVYYFVSIDLQRKIFLHFYTKFLAGN